MQKAINARAVQKRAGLVHTIIESRLLQKVDGSQIHVRIIRYDAHAHEESIEWAGPSTGTVNSSCKDVCSAGDGAEWRGRGRRQDSVLWHKDSTRVEEDCPAVKDHGYGSVQEDSQM